MCRGKPSKSESLKKYCNQSMSGPVQCGPTILFYKIGKAVSNILNKSVTAFLP